MTNVQFKDVICHTSSNPFKKLKGINDSTTK